MVWTNSEYPRWDQEFDRNTVVCECCGHLWGSHSGNRCPEEVGQKTKYRPLSAVGQIRPGYKLKFKLLGKDFYKDVLDVKDPGTQYELIVYDSTWRYTISTSEFLLNNTGHKNIEFSPY